MSPAKIRNASVVQSSKFMRTHREKVLAHAAARLGAVEQVSDPVDIAWEFRRFLKIEDQRLRIADRCGASGHWIAHARSAVLDFIVEHAFRVANNLAVASGISDKADNTCSVIALGGYGRRELAPFSDLDLLFLHTGRGSDRTRHLVERILPLLWDSGLIVGHSFRTVKECISAARSDPHLQTALTSRRLLTGNKPLFDSLSAALERERRKRIGAHIAAVQKERAERYGKFGDAVCLQEPNLKESAGGLRDFHTALWVANARYGCRSLADFREHDLISEEEERIAERAYDFLLRVRYHTHLLTGRKVEHISLELQPALAAEFGYLSDSRLLASEKFMRDYYRRAQDIYRFGESVIARTSEKDKSPSRWFGRPRAVFLGEPFSIKDGKLQLENGVQFFAKSPLRMFDAFALAQAANVHFSHGMHEAMRHNLAAVNRDFRGSAAAANAFLKLLRRRSRVGHVLRLMHEVGFLGRYLPEFGRISLLIQHDLYHHYTIDEHTLKVVEALDELDRSEDSRRAHLRAVFDEIEDPALLYLSLLLHDIGKGQGSGHVARGVQIAEGICRRLQLSAKDAARVVLIVKHHITMAHISQRRDLTEPHVAAQFATQMENLDALNMLLLLSYSDMKGVGPGVWSEWKGSLLWDLYERARLQMAGSEAPPHGPARIAQLREKIMASLEAHLTLSDVDRHLALLPDRYIRTASPEAVANHLRLIDGLESDALRWQWVQHGRTITELTVCTRDRHGLFADIAGTLTAQGIEILSAEINTREDGVAIDVFMLRTAATHQAIEERRWITIERALRAAIKGESDVAALVEKWQTQHAPRRRVRVTNGRRQALPTVVCDNKAAQAATVVEVRAADEAGLAFKIASAATALGFEIVYAKITTEKSDSFDVFYVTDAEGMRLSATAMQALELATLERICGTKRLEQFQTVTAAGDVGPSRSL
jgi:[protein-PII] uridylyltransferase